MIMTISIKKSSANGRYSAAFKYGAKYILSFYNTEYTSLHQTNQRNLPKEFVLPQVQIQHINGLCSSAERDYCGNFQIRY